MKKWYEIRNLGDRRAQVALRGIIGIEKAWADGAGTYKEFIEELNALGELDEIEVFIHSQGGFVMEGLPIYNALKNHKARVVATVEGLAGSIASVILMAADERKISKSAYVMIHNADGFVGGDYRAVRKMADDLEKFTTDLAEIYSARTGIDAKKVAKMMDDETWMSGADAVANGFADTLLDEVVLTNLARFDARTISATAHSKAPAAARALFDTSEQPTAKTTEPKPIIPPNMTTAEMQAKIDEADAKAKAAEAKAQAADAAKIKAEQEAADAKAAKEKAETEKAAADTAKAEAEKAAADAKSGSAAVEDRLKKLENMAANGVLGAATGSAPVAQPGSAATQQQDTKNMSSLQLIAAGRAALTQAKTAAPAV